MSYDGSDGSGSQQPSRNGDQGADVLMSLEFLAFLLQRELDLGGDLSEGFTLLNREYREIIIRYMKSKTPRATIHDLEDAYQAFLIALLKWVRSPSFDSSVFGKMVFTIAKREAVNVYRRMTRLSVAGVFGGDAVSQVMEEVEDSDHADDPDEIVAIVEAVAMESVAEAVESLPPKCKCVWVLYLQDLERYQGQGRYDRLATAVSEVLGSSISVGAVKKSWHYGFRKVRQKLFK